MTFKKGNKVKLNYIILKERVNDIAKESIKKFDERYNYIHTIKEIHYHGDRKTKMLVLEDNYFFFQDEVVPFEGNL
jgi:hypothetical protein